MWHLTEVACWRFIFLTVLKNFCDCKSLSRVTFGESSSLKLIGKEGSVKGVCMKFILPTVLMNFVRSAFSSARVGYSNPLVTEVHLPGGIEGLLRDRSPRSAMPYHEARLTPGTDLPERFSSHIPFLRSSWNLTCFGQLDT